MRGTQLAGLKRVRRSGLAAAALVAAVGLAVSGTAAMLVHRSERRAADSVMDRYTRSVQGAVQSEARRYTDAVRLVGAALAAQPVITEDSFRATAGPVAGLRLRGVSAAAFLVAATAADVPAVQQRWRDRGVSDLTLTVDGPGVGYDSEHLYAVLRVSLDGSTLSPGTDVSQAPQPSAALLRARAIWNTTVSAPYVLLRDRSRPQADQQRAFVLVSPVRDEQRQFLGWLLIGVRAADLMTSVLPEAGLARPDVSVYAPGDPAPIAGTSGRMNRDLTREVEIDVADQRWTLRVAADRAELPGADSHLDRGIAAAGAALSLLVAALVYVLTTARRRLEAEVGAATLDARAAEGEARRQAGLLGAVMESISDGVGVVNERGTFLLQNAAARQLMGVSFEPGTTDDWQHHYGIFRPDGVTPWPMREMPLMTALDGEVSSNVEMVVRNEGQPDGVYLNVSTRPLDPRAGQAGAVAVFHDVTERRVAEHAIRNLNTELEARVVERTAELAGQAGELRAANAELEAFSYSVSHDLRAPLRAVDGFARMLELDHGADLDDTGRRYLSRVRAGAQTMGHLIDGLLAFSRLQRQAMSSEPVRIDELVEQVWEELAPDRAGRAVELTVGDLPPALGDPRLLRQVVANLLGNAVKYSRGRDPARIEVGAASERPGEVTYHVADNGAGFDPRYVDKLFQVFQRLHRAEEYEGTGVGLALASRIIQRHGGRIWAVAAPDRGATFSFTLTPAEEAVDAVHAEADPARRGQSERPGASPARV